MTIISSEHTRLTLRRGILLIIILVITCQLHVKAQSDSILINRMDSLKIDSLKKNTRTIPDVCCYTVTVFKPIITHAQMLGIGMTSILDTYLSPEKYNGTELRYISQTTRKRPDSNWSRQITYSGNIAYTSNRNDTGNEIAGMFYFSYGAHYNWSLLNDCLILKAGALFDVNLGFIYNTRNGNNPAQARAYANLTPSFEAEYRFNIKEHRYTIRYELDTPFAGIMFSPNYGQSYYDIFSNGNYDHNAVPTTFISAPSMRQMLTIDIPIRKFALRIGYLGDYQQAAINNLKNHTYTNAIIVGIVKKFSINNLLP